MEYMWLLLALWAPVGKLEAGPRADKRDGFFTPIRLELKVWEKRPNIPLSLSLHTMTECKMLVCAYERMLWVYVCLWVMNWNSPN